MGATDAIIGGLGSIFGSMVGSNSAKEIADTTNRTNIVQAQADRQFQAEQTEKQNEDNSYEAELARSENASEAVKSRTYNTEEADKARTYNTAEAEKGRTFATGSQAEQERFDAAEAEKNRKYQETMSNSAYQRATADMKKAGVNPLLAIMQGGASTPSGSTATAGIASSGIASSGAASSGMSSGPAASHSAAGGSTARLPINTVSAEMIGDTISKGISTAVQVAQNKKDLKKKDSEIDLNKAMEQTQEQIAMNNSASAMETMQKIDFRNLTKDAVKQEAEAEAKKSGIQKSGWYAYPRSWTEALGGIFGNAKSLKDLWP